ncbi:hypothetical protein SHIRM173S_07836 [Streptomyces hirsutus]
MPTQVRRWARPPKGSSTSSRPARRPAPGVVRADGAHLPGGPYGDAWGTGRTSDLTVTGTGSTPGNGRTLEFPLDLGRTVGSGWNTNLTQGSNVITATDASHNAAIAPGASVTLGYLADHTGDASSPPRFTLNGDACAVGR